MYLYMIDGDFEDKSNQIISDIISNIDDYAVLKFNKIPTNTDCPLDYRYNITCIDRLKLAKKLINEKITVIWVNSHLTGFVELNSNKDLKRRYQPKEIFKENWNFEKKIIESIGYDNIYMYYLYSESYNKKYTKTKANIYNEAYISSIIRNKEKLNVSDDFEHELIKSYKRFEINGYYHRR